MAEMTAGSCAERSTTLAVDGENDVTRLDARLLGRTVVDDLAHQRAARTIEAEGVGELGVHFLDLHADAAARHLAGAHQLLAHVVGHVDRDRERQPM